MALAHLFVVVFALVDDSAVMLNAGFVLDLLKQPLRLFKFTAWGQMLRKHRFEHHERKSVLRVGRQHAVTRLACVVGQPRSVKERFIETERL